MDKTDFKSINWSALPKAQHLAVRSLLTKLVGKETLATHSLTGLPSNAHPQKEARPALDPVIVQDVICEYFVFEISLQIWSRQICSL